MFYRAVTTDGHTFVGFVKAMDLKTLRDKIKKMKYIAYGRTFCTSEYIKGDD